MRSVKINAAYWRGIQDRPGALMRSADTPPTPTSEQLTLSMLKFSWPQSTGIPANFKYKIMHGCYCVPPNIAGATVLPQILRVLLCYSEVPMLPCSNKELVYRLWSPKLRIILCSQWRLLMCSPEALVATVQYSAETLWYRRTDSTATLLYTVLLIWANQKMRKGSYYIVYTTHHCNMFCFIAHFKVLHISFT